MSANAKLLYGEISALTNSKGYCWASNQYFADLYKVSIKSISNWITQLEHKKYIKRELLYKDASKEILSRKIILSSALPMEENFHTYGKNLLGGIEENFHTPMEEKFQDNNTLSNNTINKSNREKKSNRKDTLSLIPLVEQSELSPPLQEVLKEWLEYKKEKKENYTEVGFKRTITEIKNNADRYGEKTVAELIGYCMAQNWKGIVFDRLKEKESKCGIMLT